MPTNQQLPPPTPPFDPVDHLLPPAHARSPIGPTIGIIIIILILITGAIYLWRTSADHPNRNDNLPLIPGDIASEATQ